MVPGAEPIEEKGESMGINDLVSVKRGGKKDSNMVVIPVERGVVTAERRWTKAKEVVKEAQEVIAKAEHTIEEYVIPRFRAACSELGHVPNSCTVGGVRLTFKGKSQFAKVKDGDLVRKEFEEDFDKYFVEQKGPIYFTKDALENQQIEKKISSFIAKLQKEHPDTTIIEREVKTITREALREEWLVGDYEKLESRMNAAHVQRSKTTFAKC